MRAPDPRAAQPTPAGLLLVCFQSLKEHVVVGSDDGAWIWSEGCRGDGDGGELSRICVRRGGCVPVGLSHGVYNCKAAREAGHSAPSRSAGRRTRRQTGGQMRNWKRRLQNTTLAKKLLLLAGCLGPHSTLKTVGHLRRDIIICCSPCSPCLRRSLVNPRRCMLERSLRRATSTCRALRCGPA